jgi:hypothetical protein
MSAQADRELLELAAKAAGIAGFWVDAGLNVGTNAAPRIWNPLTDDGDAFRLAVKLNMEVHPSRNCHGYFTLCRSPDLDLIADEPIIGQSPDDPYAAARLAITRAAAEIGKAMP